MEIFKKASQVLMGFTYWMNLLPVGFDFADRKQGINELMGSIRVVH
jgi:hypothetical protein